MQRLFLIAIFLTVMNHYQCRISLPQNMFRRAILFLSVSLCLVLTMQPEAKGQGGDVFLQPKGKGEIRVYAGGGSTRNYYNVDGNQRLFDSLETSLLALTLGMSLDYGLLDRLELNVDVPIGYFALTSARFFPDRSILSPIWYGVGLTYQVTQGPFLSSVSSQVRIPPGFHNGIYDDPNHPSFLSDGYWQFTNSINLGFVAGEVWVKGSAGYNMRGEEPVDEILYAAQVGISRIDGTGVYLGFDGVAATEDASKPLRPFYAGASGSEEEKLREDGGTGRFTTIDREDYFAVRPGAFLSLNDQLTLSAQFFVRLAGINSLALKGFYVGAGYKF